MPKPRKKETSSRRYNSYSEKTLQKALIAIKEGKISINRAAIKYNIAKGTLVNKVHGKHDKSFGAAPLFTQEEEKTLVDYVKTIKEWGYPFTMNDLKIFGKFYLDMIGREPSRFGAENMPGREWASRFMKKHKSALDYNCHQNVAGTKKEKAAFLKTKFCDHLEESLVDKDSKVPPSRIFNFSLANLSHDPFAVQRFYKQSKKYAPCITDSVTSVVFCGSAAGRLIPPFVVFKAERVSESWANGGPKDAKYSISPSGCFDQGLFMEWFRTLFIPYVKNLRGRIVLLGDYSSSLFSPQVLESAEENDIVFTCVPDGVSHCQPFYISFYAKLAYQWGLLFDAWREANGPEPIDRRFFPGLLSRLLTVTCEANSNESDLYSEDLVEGFKECGIVPFIAVNASSHKVRNVLHGFVKKKSECSETICRKERVNEETSRETICGFEETVGTESSTTSVSLSQRKMPEGSYESILVKKEDQKLTEEPVVVYLLLDFEQDSKKNSITSTS